MIITFVRGGTIFGRCLHDWWTRELQFLLDRYFTWNYA